MLNQLLSFIFSLISLIIPTNKKVYIFGSWFGEKYNDNSKYLYEYILENHPEIKAYWFTREKKVFEHLKRERKPVLYGVSINSIRLHLVAFVVFYTVSFNKDLMGPFTNKKTIKFNLWHGSPMKKIGLDVIRSGVGLKESLVESHIDSRFRKLVKKCFGGIYKKATLKRELILSSSAEISECLKTAFGLNDKQVMLAGYPKLDHFYKSDEYITGKLLYAPTYRGDYNSELDILTEFGFELKKIEDWLERENLELDIKLHPANRLPSEVEEKINDSCRVNLLEVDDIYEVLNLYEYVITDFSSIFFDALAIGKKVILAPFGIDSYLENDRELYFNVDELFPYEKSYNWVELIENFKGYKKLCQIEEARLFYNYADGESSKRIMEMLGKIDK